MQEVEPKKVIYSWDNYHSLVKGLITQFKNAPNIVVSIGKGGSIPGVIIAEHYDIKNINVGLKSYNKYDRSDIVEYQSLTNYEDLINKNILLIDDIADSGETFLYATKMLECNGCNNVITASVFYKKCSKYKPDYFAKEVDVEHWIVQPWEQ
jgi:hypoxanthine phosphoribosyltransferase